MCVCPATVIVPVRCGPVVAATVKLTVPLPFPLAPAVIDIHVSGVVAVHAHPAGVETAMSAAFPPVAGTVCALGLIDAEHPDPWLTVNVWFAMVSVPVRAAPLLAATLKLMLPLPLPLGSDVIVSQLSLAVEVHAQPEAVVTAIGMPAPPAAGDVVLVGLIDDAQEPGCVTVSNCPAMSIVPERCGPVFAVALMTTLPLPVPVPTPTTASQLTLLAAVHEQAGVVATPICVLPPPAGSVVAVG